VKREILFTSIKKRENLKGPNSKEVRAPPEANHFGSTKGYGWVDGINPLEHRCEAVEVSRESAGTDGVGGNSFPTKASEKHFVGVSPRAWETEIGLLGRWSEYRREGSQTLRVELLGS
jgi:hypothetical protein